jgi:hypothetical protein
MPESMVWADPKTGRLFRTGAIPAHRFALAGARPHEITTATPPQVIVVPSFLEMWLNDQDGDCVTAEEAAAIAFYSTFLGLPESKITDATVLAFCNAYGFLNGANLTDVMDKMISNGFQQDAGYKDGPYTAVDYSNEANLQNAISIGPVKIGIDSSALPSGAGNASGWYASGGSPQQFTNEDHCVGLVGYGPSAALFAALNTPMPAGFPATAYLLYTWSTIGVVDHAWVMSTCGEAWLRNPTTLGLGPAPVPPVPVPPVPVPPVPVPPVPTPPAGGYTVNLTISGTISPAASPSPVGPVTVDANALSKLIDQWHAQAAKPGGPSSDNPAMALAHEVIQELSVWSNTNKGVGITIPPFILALLKFVCILAPSLPPPYGAILAGLCALLPAGQRCQ